MSLTANRSLKSARRKFFMNSTYIMSRKQQSKVFWPQEAKLSLTATQLSPIGEKKIFHELGVHHVQKGGIKRFCAEEAAMNLTVYSSLKSARRKFFDELDVHHVQKVGITCFLGSGGRNESNMPISSVESARVGKFFMNSTYIMSRKWKSNVFVLRRPK